MRLHAKVVAWVFLLYGIAGLALAAGFFLLYAGLGTGALVGEGDVGAVFVGWGFGIAIGGFLAAVSLPNAVAGYGLLRRRSWGRPLGIGLAVINLIFAPIGTLFGAYALVALLGDDTSPRSLPVVAEREDMPAATPMFVLVSLLGIACATLVAITAAAFPWLSAIGGRPAVGIAAGVCGALAAVALVVGIRRAIARSRAAVTQRHRALVRALTARGALTVLDAARATGLSPEECEGALDALARKRWVEIDEAGGRTLYRVP